MTELEALKSMGGPILAIFGFAIFMIWVSFRRAGRIRQQVADLTTEHERLLVHAQLRLAAQKAEAQAWQAAGEERVRKLREAIALWRQANQNRAPDDLATFEQIKSTIGLLEEELARLGVEP